MSHASNIAEPLSHRKLEQQILINQENSCKLANLCLTGSANSVRIFLEENRTLPYGEYFESLFISVKQFRERTPVLHVAVYRKDNQLLDLLLNRVPHSVLYLRDGLNRTYEEYAESLGFKLPDNLRSHVIDKTILTQGGCDDAHKYGVMLKDKLDFARSGARGRAGGNEGETSIISQLIGFTPDPIKIPALVSKGFYKLYKKPDTIRLATWLRDEYDLQTLVDALKLAQADHSGRLKPEESPENFNSLQNRAVLIDAAYCQGRDLSHAEERAIIHAKKICEFMSQKENNTVLSMSEWLSELVKKVIGQHFVPPSLNHPQQSVETSPQHSIQLLAARISDLESQVHELKKFRSDNNNLKIQVKDLTTEVDMLKKNLKSTKDKHKNISTENVDQEDAQTYSQASSPSSSRVNFHFRQNTRITLDGDTLITTLPSNNDMSRPQI